MKAIAYQKQKVASTVTSILFPRLSEAISLHALVLHLAVVAKFVSLRESTPGLSDHLSS
jgi:hypothetical protein